jgi:hypothetical protein
MWRTVRIFISSTFRDMQSERDHLVRFVFPRVREELARRQIHFVDVDLRWGVTRDQDAFDLCMDEINRCHPRFLCLLGGRFGWTAPPKTVSGSVLESGDLTEADKAALLALYEADPHDGTWRLRPVSASMPADRALEALRRAGVREAERSITAAEIHYGALDRPRDPGFRYFYFRDVRATESVPAPHDTLYREPAGSFNARALRRLKDDIRGASARTLVAPGETVDAPLSVREYSAEWDSRTAQFMGLRAFGEAVLADILASVDAEFGAPSSSPADELSEERGAMEAFVESRLERYVVGSRRRVLDRLHQHVNSPGDSSVLLLLGESGTGKSALQARFAAELQASQEADREIVISHFLGASPRSTTARQLLWRLCRELSWHTGHTESISDVFEDLRNTFPALLTAVARLRRVVLIIDGIDRLDPAYDAHAFAWFPNRLPANVRAVVSGIPGPVADALSGRVGIPVRLDLPPLTTDDAGAIVDGFLGRYRKSLDASQRDALLAKREALKPLYLLTALEELRTLGVYEEITERIRELPDETLPLFSWILERLERDTIFRDAAGHPVGHDLVPRYCAFLALSRFGMSHGELTQLVSPGDAAGNLAALYHLLRPYLIAREDLVDFSHAQLREAVRRRYLRSEPGPDRPHGEASHMHTSLAELFAGRWPQGDRHALGEMVYHVIESADVEALAALAESSFLETKARVFSDVEALADAKQITETLARTGDGHWEALVAGAHRYCDLAERARASGGDRRPDSERQHRQGHAGHRKRDGRLAPRRVDDRRVGVPRGSRPGGPGRTSSRQRRHPRLRRAARLRLWVNPHPSLQPFLQRALAGDPSQGRVCRGRGPGGVTRVGGYLAAHPGRSRPEVCPAVVRPGGARSEFRRVDGRHAGAVAVWLLPRPDDDLKQ